MNSWCMMLSVLCILTIVNGTLGTRTPPNPCKKRQRFGSINDKKCNKWYKSIKDTESEISYWEILSNPLDHLFGTE